MSTCYADKAMEPREYSADNVKNHLLFSRHSPEMNASPPSIPFSMENTPPPRHCSRNQQFNFPPPVVLQPHYSSTGPRPLGLEPLFSSNADSSRYQPDRSVKLPALPQFSFNPGLGLAAESTTLLNQQRTPISTRSIASPARPPGFGHRRGGSEFIGGSLPSQSDSGLSSLHGGHPAAHRMHTRNRSAIPMLSPPAVFPPTDASPIVSKGKSAPTSPVTPESDESRNVFIPELFIDAGEVKDEPTNYTLASPALESPPTKPSSRTRVGFSDTLEYIPRPLSMVSSDTSSTITVSQGHKFSSSITSVVSVGYPTSVEVQASPVTRTASLGLSTLRPSTAGAVLERCSDTVSRDPGQVSSRRRNSIPTHVDVKTTTTVPPPERSPTRTSKRWTFFGLEPFVGAGSHNKSRPASSSSTRSDPAADLSATSSLEHKPNPVPKINSSRTSQLRHAGKATRKKKVKIWAGLILNRQSKLTRPSQRHIGTQTGPPYVFMSDEQAVSQPLVTDQIAVPPSPIPSIVPPETVLAGEALVRAEGAVGYVRELKDKPDKSYVRPIAVEDEDQSCPMIDLDAALGPFNTPLPRNPEWEAAEQAAILHAKRQLHSAQGMKGFGGPGMHYHRRAESAPEMVPFESRVALHRFGSSSTMADVFEEDEEDEENDASSLKDPSPLCQATLAAKNEAAVISAGPGPEITDAGAWTSEYNEIPPVESTLVESHTSAEVDRPLLSEAGITGEPKLSTSQVDQESTETCSSTRFRTNCTVRDRFEEDPSGAPRHGSGRHRSSKNLPPVEVTPLQIPPVCQSPYAASHTSSFPSPRSATSCEAPMISSAPSSVNDENQYHSLLLGEPGSELRVSVDDIPSLTSATSATTRDSLLPQPTINMFYAGSTSDRRPVSVSSAAMGRRRSSLASLSRLISSSHGERSKLSTEVTCESGAEELPKAKSSRAKRLSRLVQFWKPKVSEEAQPGPK